MSSCIQKKKIRRVRFFELDACDRMVTTGTPKLDWMGFNEVRWQNVIDDGVDELITNVNNQACVDDPSCPVDRGVSWTFTECQENDAFAALTGHGSVVINGADVIGFDRVKMGDSCPGLALEILFDVPSVCDASGNAQCLGVLVPNVRLFKDVSERLINGNTTVRGTYTARSALNSRLFELFPTPGTPSGDLQHWAPWAADISRGDTWYHRRLFECPVDALDPNAAGSCELVALDSVNPI